VLGTSPADLSSISCFLVGAWYITGRPCFFVDGGIFPHRAASYDYYSRFTNQRATRGWRTNGEFVSDTWYKRVWRETDSRSIGPSSDYSINLSLRTPICDPGEDDTVHLKNILRCNGPVGPSSEYTNSWSYSIRMAFVPRIEWCTGLLGATLDVNNMDKPCETRALEGRAVSSGGSCGRRVTHSRCLNDSYGPTEWRRE
jgi:hypothetical protein